MSKRLAVTENGKHKIGKKLFFTNENLIFRKVKKAFITKDGIHRLVYSSGTVWEKWKCDVYTRTYEEHTRTSYMVGNTTTDSLSVDDCIYKDYSFWTYSGFEGEGSQYQVGDNNGNIRDWIVGYYIVYETEVYKITSLDDANGSVTCVIVDACDVEEIVERTYQKGNDSFGTVEAEEGALPESGRLVEGSVEEGYCVLQINGVHYYYECLSDVSEPAYSTEANEYGTTVILKSHTEEANEYGTTVIV